MTETYAPLFLMFAVAAVIAVAVWMATPLLGAKGAPNPEKYTPYESGSESSGARHVNVSVKFYLTAILFVVFDVEAIFIYPWAVLYRSLGGMGLAVMTAFIAALGLALVYCWKKGALEWET